MKHILILLVIIFCFLIKPANAQWVRTNGPYGGHIRCFVADDTFIYAGTKQGDIFRSSNNGDSWELVENDLYWVESLIIIDSNIFSRTQIGVFVSSNQGTNWTWLSHGMQETDVKCLIFKDSILFAGTEIVGICITTNNGKTWEIRNNGLPDTCYVYSLVLIDSILFASAGYDGVYKSTNNGISWSPVNNGLNADHVFRLYRSGSNLIAGTVDGIFITTNNGKNWREAFNNLNNLYALSFTTLGTKLFAGTQSGIFVSMDDGNSWNLINDSIYFISLMAYNSKLFAALSGYGIYISNDEGINWIDGSNGLYNAEVNTMLSKGNLIFAGTEGSGIFLSSNYGDSWIRNNNGLKDGYISSLTEIDSIILAGTGRGLYLSSDNGNIWKMLDNELLYYPILSLVVKGTNIFAGTSSTGIFKSTNNGLTWNRVNTGLTQFKIKSLATNGINIYAGSDSGYVFYSSNNGLSWNSIRIGFTKYSVYSLIAIGSHLYAATYGDGVFYSSNYGANWKKIDDGFKNSLAKVAYVFNDDNIFFIGTNYGDISLLSNDTSWTDVSDGLAQYSHIKSVTLHDSILFVGTWRTGFSIWRRPLSELITIKIPSQLTLEQNNPNPFNSNTEFKYGIPKDGNVIFRIYDIQGQLVKNLVSDFEIAGSHTISWDGRDESGIDVFTGVYICRIQFEGQSLSKKMFFVP